MPLLSLLLREARTSQRRTTGPRCGRRAGRRDIASGRRRCPSVVCVRVRGHLSRRTLGLRTECEGVNTSERGLEDSVIPDLEAIVVDARARGLRRTLFKDARCLLIEFALRDLVGRRRWGRGRVVRGGIAHVGRPRLPLVVIGASERGGNSGQRFRKARGMA